MVNPARLAALRKHGPITKTHPHIIKWWHPKKNGKKKPKNYPYTSQEKIWWICDKSHLIFVTIQTKAKATSKSGCEICYNKFERSYDQRIRNVKKHGSLSDKNPLLAKELHKDNDLKASEVPINYRKTRLKWKCFKCGNIKYASVQERHQGYNKFTGCDNSKCENYRYLFLAAHNIKQGLKKHGNLEENFPELLKEWDYKKNKKPPSSYTRSSAKKVWWTCSKGHSWLAIIGNRTLGKTGCPDCTKIGFSKLEMRVFCELRYIFKDVIYHASIRSNEADVFLKNYNLVVEVDGYLSHFKKNKRNKDIQKNKRFEKNGYKIIRIRDQNLKKISKHDVLLTKNELELKDIKKLVITINKIIKANKEDKNKINIYKKTKFFKSTKSYNFMIKTLPDPPKEVSLPFKFPDIADEWHPTKNGKLQPSMFAYGSKQKIWWKCFLGHKPFKQSIEMRTRRNQGCPKCGLIKQSKTRIKNLLKKNGSIADKFPEITKLFLEKENKISPKFVHIYSKVEYWWFCKLHNYKWEISANEIIRRKTPCKYCSYDKKRSVH